MSVQLIVYPQYFDGSPNPLANASTQYLIDGINFTTVNTSSETSSSASNVVQDSINTIVPTMSVNTWYRYKETSAASVSLFSGKLKFKPDGADSPVGIIQKLSNLVVGAVYNVTFDVAVFTGTGAFECRTYSGTILQSNQSVAGVAGQTVTVQFTANTNEDLIVFNTKTAGSGTAQAVELTSISILAAPTQPSGATQTLENGQVICDLYEDEDIPLTLSVDEFKNAAEKVQSYSKAFNLPATKRNNRIFENMFEITRTAQGDISFNPYVKTQCILKQDGFILFEGYLRMIDISDKEGEISYNVNLYSEVISLADFLKEKTFSELDFTELTHDYTVTQVQNSWDEGSGTGIAYTNPSTSGFRKQYGTLCYPFVDWIHQYTQDANGVILPNLESTFRPFINIKYLIDRMFNQPNFPFTYSSDFFESTHFNRLYMDFNWGSNSVPIEGNGENFLGTVTSTTAFQNLRLDTPAFSDEFGYDNTNHRFVAPQDNTGYIISSFFYNVTINSSDVFTFRWVHLDASGNVLNIYNFASATQAGAFINAAGNNVVANLQQNETLQFQFKTAVAGSGTQRTASNLAQAEVIAFTGMTTATDNTLLQTLRGELGQWDFLKGLMTMFNLITLPDEDNPNNIKFEPYPEVFISDTGSIQHDWTDKVDIADIKLKPLTDLNKTTIFKFVEDEDDFCFRRYKEQIGRHLYGSKIFDASTSATGLKTIFQGTNEIIAEPFAATIIAPLMPQFTDLVIPKIYASEDDETKGFENSPRIMYNNGKKATGVDCYVPEQNGSGAIYLTQFLQFSHLSDVPTVSGTATSQGSLDFHFGQCQLPIEVGAPVPDNLFNLYWLPYYAELYNEDTRIMTIKVNLNAADINTFKFNDLVMIKNRTFRVNKINYKPNDLATVEFILIP
tara:strand:+ start:1434 stop:4136 length:2703 start_codon:yes stop_codon:yes gene_type:complete